MTTSCYFCNEIERLQEHHIVPRRFDGSDDEENLVKLCPTCHDKIENLYNKRFYDALGVEKDSENGLGICAHSECFGDATNRVSGPAGTVDVCDMHNDCDRGNCSNKSTTTRENNPGTSILCESCSVCKCPECSSTKTMLVSEESDMFQHIRVYCSGHVPEDDDYRTYTVIADD